MPSNRAASVFVSYARQDNDHGDVSRLVNMLESNGIKVVSDITSNESKEHGVAQWCASSIASSDGVIVVCGAGLVRSLREKIVNSTARFEYDHILERARASNEPGSVILPVTFTDSIECIPNELRTYERFYISRQLLSDDSQFKRLVNIIRASANIKKAPQNSGHPSNQTSRPPREKVLFTQIGEQVSWQDTNDILCDLNKNLGIYKDRPDIVVSLNTEGALVASLFCLNYRIRPMFSIESRFVMKGDIPGTELYERLDSKDFIGKRVLLIDSEANSGATMNQARNYLRSLKASSVFTFVLAKSENCPIPVDYIGFEFNRRPYFPWEWTTPFSDSRHKKSIRERYE